MGDCSAVGLGSAVELGSAAIWIGGSVGSAIGKADDGEGTLARARAALETAKSMGLGRYYVDKRGF